MKKYYLSILILGIFVILLGIFIIGETGLPWDIAAEKEDIAIINKLYTVVNTVRQYYFQNKKLPESKENIYNYHSANIIPAINNLMPYSEARPLGGIGTDNTDEIAYDYNKKDELTYELCSTFKTEVNEESIAKRIKKTGYDQYQYYGPEVFRTHPKGYVCFPLKVEKIPEITISPSIYPPVIYNQTYSDSHIKTVTTDAKRIWNKNFPYSLFNTTDEWGLVNYSPDTVHATVIFKEPVSIKYITNRFSVCDNAPCYEWSATGETTEKKKITLISNTNSTVRADPQYLESKKETESREKVTSVDFTITRLYGDKYVHWRKLFFEYEN